MFVNVEFISGGVISIYQNYCKKCGSTSLHTEVKGSNTGLYCDDCGAFLKWLGKDELRAFEYVKKIPETDQIIVNLRNFIQYLEQKIDAEYEKMPISSEDAIGKSSYCLALQQSACALQNILNGKGWDYRE